MDQEIIIRQLKEGKNESALKGLYEVFPSVRQFVNMHGGNDDDARDVFQEALMVFYRNIQKSDFVLTCALSTYLVSIVRYKWKDELKKKNRIVSFEVEVKDVAADVSGYQQEEERMGILEKVLDQLGDKCREILQLFYYGKKSMDEIAGILDYRNVDTVKTQKYKCIDRAKNMARELMVSSVKAEQ